MWRGRAEADRQEAYADHFRHNVLPALRRIDGFLGASLLKEEQGDTVEFLVLTKWTSMDAIHAFAGKEVNRAVVEPEAIAALLKFDRTVLHYEIVDETSGRTPGVIGS